MSATPLMSVLRNLFRLLTSCGVLALLLLAFGAAGATVAMPAEATQAVAQNGALTESPGSVPVAALPSAVVLDDVAAPGATLDGEPDLRLDVPFAGPRLPARSNAWQRPASVPMHCGPAPRGLLRPPDA